MTGLEVLNLLMDIRMDVVNNSPITTNPTVIFLTLFSVIPPYKAAQLTHKLTDSLILKTVQSKPSFFTSP
jgi:hypothetical protein